MPLCRQCHGRETKSALASTKQNPTETPQSVTTNATDATGSPVEVTKFKNSADNDSLRLECKP